MKVIITGGNGFLGLSLIKKLVSNSHKVLVFSPNSNNLKDVIDIVEYHSASTVDILKYELVIRKFEPDVVVHCGWSGGSSYASTNSLSQFYDNIDPSIKLIELLSSLPKKPMFVGFGSFAEYGVHHNSITETHSTNPLNLYGLSKLTFMNFSKMFCSMSSMEWMWIRPCYVYGPGDVPTRLIPSLISKFLKNQDVILDECNSTIDYLFIDDFVNQIYILIVKKATGIFNLCSGNQYKVRDIVNFLHKNINCTSKVTYDSSLNRSTIPNYVCGSSLKLITETKYNNLISIQDGLIKTINYYKNYEK